MIQASRLTRDICQTCENLEKECVEIYVSKSIFVACFSYLCHFTLYPRQQKLPNITV